MGGGPSRPCDAASYLGGNPADACTQCLSKHSDSLDDSLHECFGADPPRFYSNLLSAARLSAETPDQRSRVPSSLDSAATKAALRNAFAPASGNKAWAKTRRTGITKQSLDQNKGEDLAAFDARCTKTCDNDPDCAYFFASFRTGKGRCTMYNYKTANPPPGVTPAYLKHKPA